MSTPLRRLGKKTKIAPQIIQHFPPFEIYIDMFCGALGMYTALPKAPTCAFLNDLDSDVFNFWTVFTRRTDEFLDLMTTLPTDQTLFNYWGRNKETDPLLQAARFLMLSNYGYMGKSETMRIGTENTKAQFFKHAKTLLQKMDGRVKTFLCEDFRKVLKICSNVIEVDEGRNKSKTFIYADPPYLSTSNNYQNGFTTKDTIDLFQILVDSGCKPALSEFKNETVIEVAKSHNLNIIELGERQSMKNRSTEILVLNYESPAQTRNNATQSTIIF